MNSVGKSCCAFWNSSIGKKIVVAVTGIFLVLFLLGHMAGNLLLFAGRDAINEYAEFLHHMLHGAGIWFVRIGLLVLLGLHVAATISLTRQNKAARKDAYAHEATVQASRSSRMMIISGLIILAFIIFHILHFTIRVDENLANMKDPSHPERHDVYGMVIKGFEVPLVSIFYIVAISLLCSHLSHGIASIFQTLGMRSRKTEKPIKGLSWAITIVLWIGFLIIPLTILLNIINDDGGKKEKTANVQCTLPQRTVYTQPMYSVHSPSSHA